jgi:hypothetical protein
MRSFSIQIINIHSNLFKEGNENMIIVYRNLFYSSRNQFACLFTIERREEMQGDIKVIINSWLILKSRNIAMSPYIENPLTNIIDYEAIQTWVFKGNFILEDLVMVFKFYQIWDNESWYCPLEIEAMEDLR